MRFYIIAGEASGDLHAANLMSRLKLKDPQAEFRFWGGDLMNAQGGTLIKHYRELAFMGFVEVLNNLSTILNNLKFCKKDILEFQPDAVILVDYPGFNLRIAEFAHKAGIKVIYYISPQVWAWKKSRVHSIKKHVDKMLVILPFEKDFYDGFNYKVDFVGHPLLDAIKDFKQLEIDALSTLDNRPLIALLPGSRKQEIERMLPKMLKVVKHFKAYRFVLCAVNTIDTKLYDTWCSGYEVDIVYGQTYGILSKAYAALVTSGTATLETALFNVPQVVCYDAGYLSYLIAKNLIQLKYISLVNLIMDRKVVTELIQRELNETNIVKELRSITQDATNRNEVLNNYSQLKEILGGSGASEKAAALIYEYMKK